MDETAFRALFRLAAFSVGILTWGTLRHASLEICSKRNYTATVMKVQL